MPVWIPQRHVTFPDFEYLINTWTLHRAFCARKDCRENTTITPQFCILGLPCSTCVFPFLLPLSIPLHNSLARLQGVSCLGRFSLLALAFTFKKNKQNQKQPLKQNKQENKSSQAFWFLSSPSTQAYPGKSHPGYFTQSLAPISKVPGWCWRRGFTLSRCLGTALKAFFQQPTSSIKNQALNL